MKNLIKKFTTPYETAPFSTIKNEDFLPTIKHEIEEAKKEIDTIVTNQELPTYKNVIEALEFSGEQLDRVTTLFFNLNSAETNSEIQKLAQEISPLLSDYSSDIRLNELLFEKVKTIYNQKEKLELSTEQLTLLDKKYKGFSRNGANLSQEDKETLRQIDKELSKLSLKFGENVLAETNNFELLITNKSDLKGIPETVLEAANHLATSKNKEGWMFTLDYPSYVPFMKYADNRELRKKMSLAFSSKGFHGDQLDNQKNVLNIVKLRHQRANLLGYKTHAHFVLEERMAESPENVSSFLSELLQKAKPAAIKEFNQLQKFAKKADNIDDLQKWDGAYYIEKLKTQLFNLDDQKLKPYFQLENVINGVFTVAQKLFGLTFSEVNNIDKYHEEVKTYKVIDEKNALVAIFYADFHPRLGKRGGAWMTSYKSQYIKDSTNERPHVSIVCNFTKPTKTQPSLLTFNEVTTLFHEFGHALHGILANTTYPSLSGTSVHWDFVELPSQIMENWCYEEEALALFANHYKTGETIPIEYIHKIKESSTFMEGMQTLRQLSFAILDMQWHGQSLININSVKDIEKEIFENTDLYPDIEETCMSTSFSHIFQGGYSAGYYSYKWAEVLDADAFELFKEKGIFNKETATNFKENVLSKGGIESPMNLYQRFRGKKPNPEALLRRAGLLN